MTRVESVMYMGWGLRGEGGGRRGEGNVMGAIWMAGLGADRVLELVDVLVLGLWGMGLVVGFGLEGRLRGGSG